MKTAPVVVFGYKRKDKLEKCLSALNNNDLVNESDLYIFLDGAKSPEEEDQVNEVRNFVKRFQQHLLFNNVHIIERERNIGLANSVIEGVTQIIDRYGKVIVVEDDLVASKDFLRYMNDGLTFYEDLREYGSVSGYTLPIKELDKYNKDVYVTRKGECWGWGTWKDRWVKVDWEIKNYPEYINENKMRKEFNRLQSNLDYLLGLQMQQKIDSWAVRWCFYLFQEHLLTVYPRESRIKNIGADGTGTHMSETLIYNRGWSDNHEICKFERFDINRRLEHSASVYESGTKLQIMINRFNIWGRKIMDRFLSLVCSKER